MDEVNSPGSVSSEPPDSLPRGLFSQHSLAGRMLRAAKLDSTLYEEVEHDPAATLQAMVVVILSSVAAGAGALFLGDFSGLIFRALEALLGWVAWASLTYLIGTRLLPEPATSSDMGEMLRTVGFSSSPGLIRIAALLPFLIPIPPSIAGNSSEDVFQIRLAIFDTVHFAAWIWMLVAMVIGVRQALDYKSTGRAIGVCLIALTIVFIIMKVAGIGPLAQSAH